MEDVLDLYTEPYDRRYPVVCFDESPYQLVSEVRQPVLAAPGPPVRYDYEYRREGTCHLFMCLQPLGGWRHVKVTDRRTAQDFAHGMKDLVDSHVPQATLISVVLDNLNTHSPAAWYDTLTPAEARRLRQHLEFRYTPTHGSWLNMAAIECAVLSTQCLTRRLPHQVTVRRRIEAWETGRNAATATINGRFTTTKARRTLKRLYPS
jgi:DDE superfamily endonuclease